MIEYTLKRSNRKTLSAHILNDGTIEVRAPLWVEKSFIDKFVQKNEETLKKYASERLLANARRDKFRVEIGSKLMFLGEEYTVVQSERDIDIANGKFYVQSFNVKEQVTALYKGYARKILNEKVKKYADIMRLFPTAVKIGNAKTRWGSCSSKGTITFSWFLVMANEKAVDYVVIHELAHLKYMNHSKDFWRLVSVYEPNCKTRRAELFELSKRLCTENW